MAIIEVNLLEDVTTPLGLKPVTMRKIGSMVLLAGKNGSGKTRLLKVIKEQAANAWALRDEKARSPARLGQYNQAIQTMRQEILANPQKTDELSAKIQAIASKIQQQEEMLRRPDPIITDTDIPVTVVEFVPKKVDLRDWADTSKKDWMNRAQQAKNIGVGHLDSSCLPLIQNVVERWVNTSHQGMSFTDLDKKAALDEYNRLQNIIEKFLGTRVEWDKDGYTTLFGKPIAKAQLSDGQKVILQLCVAIFAQGGNFSNQVIFMDEPENHLHPSVVIDFLDSIREHDPSGQIWIATHSIPLLSHFDESSIWFVDEGEISYAGRKPERVLAGLLGNEDRIQKLRNFTGLPADLARNRFAFECLQPPTAVLTNSKDPQVVQLYQQLKIIWERKATINLLDFGAGKGRMISYLNEYESVSTTSLNYFAYDNNSQDREICMKNISSIYGESESKDRYYEAIESLRTKVDDYYFDVVIVCNVLHEIEHTKWCSIFRSIYSLLQDGGYLLIIEDCRIPIGELPHQNGFIVLNTLHLKKLFGIPAGESRFVAHDARFDSVEERGRLMAHLIPKEYLNQVSIDTIKASINELRNTAIAEIGKIRGAAASYSKGLAHAFWVHQLANASLVLEEM